MQKLEAPSTALPEPPLNKVSCVSNYLLKLEKSSFKVPVFASLEDQVIFCSFKEVPRFSGFTFSFPRGKELEFKENHCCAELGLDAGLVITRDIFFCQHSLFLHILNDNSGKFLVDYK